jgi:uncharacterized membrane protein
MKRALRIILSVVMVAIGLAHFATPGDFVRIVPAWLPHPWALVMVSGVFEVLGGIGLAVPRTRRAAALGLVLLYVAVFPANVNMAVHRIALDATPLPDWALWLRLPFQVAFIALALWVSGKDPPPSPRG